MVALVAFGPVHRAFHLKDLLTSWSLSLWFSSYCVVKFRVRLLTGKVGQDSPVNGADGFLSHRWIYRLCESELELALSAKHVNNIQGM